ncbi:hypothetical protein RRG08_001923 [Elysia crispata]|uniref:Uncharacterized protein n=1 Tax=Elysia crispata TaxID=231223 RepID=A0AAE1BBA3_9GAST|nr:hypothetical protein RRG08_001923 [Elysia crispata]
MHGSFKTNKPRVFYPNVVCSTADSPRYAVKNGRRAYVCFLAHDWYATDLAGVTTLSTCSHLLFYADSKIMQVTFDADRFISNDISRSLPSKSLSDLGRTKMPADTKDIRSLEKLRDLLHMLDPSKSSETAEKTSSLLRLLRKSSRRHADYYHCIRKWKSNSGPGDIIPHFVKWLRGCVLTHQWGKALKLVEAMSREMTSADSTIWKVGTACLLQMGESKSELLQQFVKQVSTLRSISVVEVLVEFLLHLLTQGNLSEAKELKLDLRKNTKRIGSMKDPKRQVAQTLFEAYQGLILYAQWKQALLSQDQESLELSQDPVHQSSQFSVSVAEPRLLANAAIESLSTVQDKPGVWDIFISRVVEMQVFYGSVETARDLLTDYAYKNANNPNSHRYLYELETSTSNKLELREKYLKDLITLDPCNPLSVELYKIIGEKQPSSVSLLFDYLDYDHCSNDLTVLNLLALRLNDVSKNAMLERVVKDCWEIRSSWWPATVLKDAFSKRSKIPHAEVQTSTNIWQIVDVKRKIYKILRNV